MNYADSIGFLTSTGKFQIKLGLERIKKLLERIKALLNLIGNPENKIKIIHVAGTNGKGSVCALLANILKCSGYKTGLYTSPHILEYAERIKINGLLISQNDFARIITEICNIAKINNIDLTEFEILTAVAFKYFADNGVDFAVVETGLGGRFDATNVCDNPVCSIITSISLDHTDRLGDTVEKIAFEKAGIIKKNSYVVVSSSNAGYEVIKKRALQTGTNIITVTKNADIKYENGVNYLFLGKNKYEFPLLGLYQKQNAALVIAASDLLVKKGFKISLKEGIETVKWGARLEYIKENNVLIDGAHNPSAAEELKKSLDYYFPGQKRIFIYGTINTKDYKTIAKILFTGNEEIFYYEFNHKNAVSFEEYKNNVPFLNNIKPFEDSVLNRKEIKILTGSFYMIGDFLQKYKLPLVT